MLRCRQAAAAATVAYVLTVLVVTISIAVASAAFSGLLIVVCAPTLLLLPVSLSPLWLRKAAVWLLLLWCCR
jgi:hypothetical protein